MNTNFSSFGLNLEQTRVLFALERIIIDADCNFEHNENPFFGTNKYSEKIQWRAKWDDSIRLFLKAKLGAENDNIYMNRSQLRSLIAEQNNVTHNKVWNYMVLLECVLFCPYYPLSDNKEDNKKLKKLKFKDSVKRDALVEISNLLGIDEKYIESFEKAYNSASKSLSGYWTKVAISITIGIVVVIAAVLSFQYEIVVLFAAQGLSGAAAMAAGLAALGGGAIAAGGAGMAGGFAVLIGGGALLGVGAGAAAGFPLASLGSSAVLHESAKMQVVLKEIVIAIQKDVFYFQKIIDGIVDQIAELKKEVSKLKMQAKDNKKKIKELEKCIDILNKLIDNSQK